MNLPQYPRVLVLILSYNGKYLLEEAISSYLACDYPEFNVAVIDNGSTDGTEYYVKNVFPEVILIRTEKNIGYSGGMNLGLTYAFDNNQYGYVLITNNDVKADSGIISALVATAQNNENVGFVTGKVYYYDKSDTFQTVGKKSHPVLINGGHIGKGEIDKGQYDQDTVLAFCDDIFWLVTRTVYERTGGYDPDFFLQCEEFDWQLRARKAGFKILYAYKARLWHKESMTLGKMSPQKAYYDARNPMIAIIKNCDYKTTIRFLYQIIICLQIPGILRCALRGKWKIAVATLRGLISALGWGAKHLLTPGQRK